MKLPDVICPWCRNVIPLDSIERLGAPTEHLSMCLCRKCCLFSWRTDGELKLTRFTKEDLDVLLSAPDTFMRVAELAVIQEQLELEGKLPTIYEVD